MNPILKYWPQLLVYTAIVAQCAVVLWIVPTLYKDVGEMKTALVEVRTDVKWLKKNAPSDSTKEVAPIDRLVTK